MANFLLKVVNAGTPVQGATVELVGVGVEDTDRDGKASIPIPATLTTQYRGSRAATRMNKSAGLVADAPVTLRLKVVWASGALGTDVELVPGVETTIDIGV